MSKSVIADPTATPAATAAGGPAAPPPPAPLPGLAFAAALGFLLAGAAGLVLHAPDLARTNFLAPRVGALTHLFTLGWITTSIMGALYQFLSVALDEPIRSVRLAYATLALHVPGLALFVAGLASVTPVLMLTGAAVLGAGLLLFIGNLTATLARARRRDVTWWALVFATFYLAVTLVLGLALTGNLRWGYLGGGRLAAIGVHLHVALAGWVLLVMIGVGHRLLPMFLLSHGARDHFARASVGLVAAGTGMLAVLHHAPAVVSLWLPSLLIALGCAAFLAQAGSYYATRRRRDLDPGMRLVAASLALLAVALLMAGPVLVKLVPLRVGVAYVVAVLLAITLFVAAHYYRIVPFLVWYHRFGPLAGTRPLPRVSDLYSTRWAHAAGVSLGVGCAGLVAAVASGHGLAAQAAAAIFACGAAIVGAQMTLVWRTHP